ncbi:MAG: ABC transporter permease [Treponemataceae bacterium]
MLEDFFVALQNFRLHKMRTFLSLLGIIIGIFTVSIITNLGSSMYASLKMIFSSSLDMPMNLITVYPNWSREKKRMSLELTEKYRQGLLKDSDKIEYVFYTSDYSGNVLKGTAEMHKDRRMQTLTGVERDYLKAKKISIEYGEDFSYSDFAERRQKAIIGSDLAKELFPEGSPLGKKFSMSFGQRQSFQMNNGAQQPILFYFEVVGVLKANKNSNRPSYDIFVPRTFLTSLTHSKSSPMAEVFIKDEKDYKSVMDTIKTYSDKFAGTEDSVYPSSAKSVMTEVNKALTIIELVLSGVAFISLFVGGINIMNIMTATVNERKKEIGIRKAIGATRQNIHSQFLIEAATLTLTGGIIGVALGILASYGIVSIIPLDAIVGFEIPDSKMQFVINTQGTLIAFLVSLTVGIIFGIRPAIKASKLDPIVALS